MWAGYPPSVDFKTKERGRQQFAEGRVGETVCRRTYPHSN